MKKILPIGTVVCLRGQNKVRRMLIGYFPKRGNQIFDYLGVACPTGLTHEKKVFLINESDILHVEQIGYENELFSRMAENMTRLMTKDENIFRNIEDEG